MVFKTRRTPAARLFLRTIHMAQTWFVTGSSSGFGRLLAEKLLARGDRVAATLRKVHALDDLKEQFGERLWVASLDVTDTEAVRQVTSRAFAELGRIDVIVSNAGYGLVGAAEELSDEQIRLQVDTNLIGSIQVIRAVLPFLRTQGGGRILQVSSEGGQITYPDFSLYHATKWGVEGFVEAVATEVAPFGIEFTIVEPGPAKTSFSGGIVKSTPMAIYDNTPAGDVRRAIESGSFALKGDPLKMVQAMIDSVERTPAPLRLTLGSDAFDRVRAGLSKRLAELDAQEDIARSTELTDA
jgi:NAD(P)-dependent dehydrogenase (short-subunit alcohol dehydrogenase family)